MYTIALAGVIGAMVVFVIVLGGVSWFSRAP
jgi:hypothetical protein